MNIVTEAFGFTGQYITRRLLQMGEAVVNLTGHPGRPHAFGDRVPSRPFNFDTPAELAKTPEAARALHNTYWARFPYKRTTFDLAIQNTLALFRAAREAGVRRVVHVSITNPSEDSPLPYFRSKAILGGHPH